jgi:hypothetical protein
MDVWAGRTLRDRDPVWEARLAEIERMEADRCWYLQLYHY